MRAFLLVKEEALDPLMPFDRYQPMPDLQRLLLVDFATRVTALWKAAVIY